jgi:DNA-directed RNA polymerase beta' subunit
MRKAVCVGERFRQEVVGRRVDFKGKLRIAAPYRRALTEKVGVPRIRKPVRVFIGQATRGNISMDRLP